MRAREWTARGMVVVATAGALLLAGCGGSEDVKSANSVVEAQSSAPPQGTPVAASPAVAVKAPLATRAEPTRESAESLPPDIEVSPVDTLVSPGQPVELVVRTTSDVTRLALSDGSGESLAFVREAGTDLWKVTYRVPLRVRPERRGLSITARTDANRWRRVWIFLHARDGTTSVGVKPDTTALTTP